MINFNQIKRGKEVLVQVFKEVTGNKGANMTTYLSLPGRCLVLMPGSDSAGISRKISGEQRRSRLREIMSGFNIPEGVGYIVRTASAEITKTALQQDLRYLTGLWKEIKKLGQTASAPALVYEDQDTVHRFLRDHFTQDIQEIIVDTEESYNQVKQFVDLLPARQKKVQVKLHRGAKPIFNQNNIEEQIESIYQPQVQLPSGGSIVIDPTEALVAIDVNSGRTSQKGDFEKSIFLANMEAAEELARQLRLRDLGGLIVVDFIDMRSKNNIKEVEKQVKNAMKRDKAKVDISRISRFGLMQISRQKMGAPIEKGSYRRCVHCEGRGLVRSVETLALYYLRRIQTGVARKKIKRVEATLPLEVGQYLLNQKRAEIMELESKHQAGIIILPNPEMKPSENNIRFLS
ncbi:MAG: Rne/Rng family ribonuclease [Candidatus Electrothrix sp. AS4_5]|nr:Rne/Rng family ribonuclease [Candidatus Electrothrix gigas]